MKTYAELLDVAMTAVDLAQKQALTTRPSSTTGKGDRDMATDVDFAIERELREFLATRTPDIGFLGEEEGSMGEASERLMWCLDPIDGTVNFISGSPLCGIALGLLDGDQAVIAVLDLPFLGNRYHAIVGQGAYASGDRISISTTRRLHDAVVAIGDYAVGENAEIKNRSRIAIANKLAERALRVRMHGSAAVDLSWFAEGRVDAMVMVDANNAWDTAAGVLLAREAGAVVVDRYGAPHSTATRDAIGANEELLDELLELIQGTATAVA
jgi:myo-inositol-1(or 4)-monophosphatase